MTGISLALRLVALAGWWIVGSRPFAGRTRLMTATRIALVLAVLLAHLNVARIVAPGALVIQAPKPHYHDALHYYLGTRYFAELGYTGLYFALNLADFEDAHERFDPRGPVRDLSRGEILPRALAVDAARGVRAAFSPERWQAFKREVAVFRAAIEPPRWRTLVADHGYNGTPLVTALLGAIAHQPWISTQQFLSLLRVVDLLLIGAFASFLALRGGGMLATAFLFFTFANPLNAYGIIGGSYLRYAYFLALAAGLYSLRRGRMGSTGIWLALAGWMRIFPLAIYGFLLLHDLAGSGWRERLRSNARLHVSFAIATLAILAGTSLVPTPDGRNPWLAFADKISAHASKPGVNQVFLAVALSYSPANDRLHEGIRSGDEANQSPEASLSWAAAAERTRRDRAWLVGAAAVALLGLSLATLRRAPPTAVMLPSLLAVFCLMPMTSYDWVVLSLLPIVSREGSSRGLVILFALLTVTRVVPIGLDLRYALLSVEVLAFLTFSCAEEWRAGRRGAATRPG